ncbi:MAG TPA: hypothetical protein VMU89_22675 [Thermomicrobiaceae bacterium]|nr:hypothetical protein [Thermomicrobiaceae bacterium]
MTLPVDELVLLAELLGELDEFLRSPAHHDVVFGALRTHVTGGGRPDAGYLIDAVQLTAAYLRRLAAVVEIEAEQAAATERVDGDE